MAMRVPFDSLTLAAVAHELQPLVGARVQRVVQPSPMELVLGLYRQSEHYLLLSADPAYARAHLIARRPAKMDEPPAFGREVRSRIADARLELVRQVGLDRVLELGFVGESGSFRLVAELMGRHANLILIDGDQRCLAAAKWIGPSKSKRPLLPGKPYEAPPFEPKPSLLEARPGDDPSAFDGWSPFLGKLLAAGFPLERVQRALAEGDWEPVYADQIGAYPLPIDRLGVPQAVPRQSLSQALEQHFAGLIERQAGDSARASLTAQLARVLAARESALREVRKGLETAGQSDALQREGQIILAYQGAIRPGSARLEAWDFEGMPVTLELDPEATPAENAQRRFDRAKRAKAGAESLSEQEQRLADEAHDLQDALDRVAEAHTPRELEAIRDEADARRWLHKAGVARHAEDRPFEGKAVREALAPGGWRVLYGDNAEANDYLTSRVARPNDWWLHVRGHVGSHVVVATGNKPDRVPQDVLRFAAELAVRHSSVKHSSYVPVDLTLKKYVRKPRGSAPGAAVYTNERTLHVEGA